MRRDVSGLTQGKHTSRCDVLGIDVGAESVKVVGLRGAPGATSVVFRRHVAHAKAPHEAVATALAGVELSQVRGIAATGRLSRVLRARQVPVKAAARRGARLLHPELDDLTVISIGAHGFSVLELFKGGQEHFRQNSRCSQGTGNFLSQLVERFGLDIEEASRLCAEEERPAPLSGRCPVILKTDMTHLANKGEDRARILAGLYDAVCENVVTLVRPGQAPRDVVLIGGVTRSLRIRRGIERWLAARGMRLVMAHPDDDVLEALGAAAYVLEAEDAGERHAHVHELLATAHGTELERVPGLRAALTQVRRIPRRDFSVSWDQPRDVLLGLDIGSTGSKGVAVDAASGDPLWEGYLNTEGSPVHAAQRLVQRWAEGPGERARVIGFGVTGSGREVVGSLLRTCYGLERVFVMNEIAAHARGALSIDPEVDTIFEIGGQDAKYIRLDAGRVVDAAMNEACSAGTGSFIAEQGAKLDGVGPDPMLLGQLALEADHGTSLGQHCSVFMAEVIDEAVTQGEPREAIVAGLYDSVIQNYLNRVKGARTVGERIFCQGMPFSADALAAAVARQTGRTVVVPPNPGTIGALGIALLARDERRDIGDEAGLDCGRFLRAEVSGKETFVCRSTKGCGGAGNRCRIDRLLTRVDGVEQRFLWGGNCSLYDRGAARQKLPDLAPDPFREREALIDALLAGAPQRPDGPVIALSEEFALKGHLPLFVTFFAKLGLVPRVARGAGSATLKKGIEGARVPYCAPMQLYHGVWFELVEQGGADLLFIPMLRSLPRVAEGDAGELCPIVLGSPDLVSGALPATPARVLRPVIDFDVAGYDGAVFERCMRELMRELAPLCPEGEGRFQEAFSAAVTAQREFEAECEAIGGRALAFCEREGVVPVVVHGRPYTIYNDVLNSNVPSILRSLGAVAIPLDCVPVSEPTPALPNQYWTYTQRNLKVAWWVRKTPSVYSIFCSNYACGPDSFTLHFFAYVMQNKPFAIVETDGHSGDAGTKTRVEAFLYCVDTDRRSSASTNAARTDFAALEARAVDWDETRRRNARVLLPRMSENALVAAAALRAEGFRAEALPLSTREDVRIGRQYTSGKECVPMMLTLGALLKRVRQCEPDEPVTFFMPTTRGPCRFGVYNSLHKLALERAGEARHVDIVSPDDTDYYRGVSGNFPVRMWLGFATHDLLQAMLYDVRPVERAPGQANAIFTRHRDELVSLMERTPGGSALAGLAQLASGMWGMRGLLERAAREFAAAKDGARHLPTVAVVGEIYVRLDPFANDFIVDKLEERGLRVRFAPFTEWLEYVTYLGEERIKSRRTVPGDDPIGTTLTGLVQRVSQTVLWSTCARQLGWGARTTVEETLHASLPFVHPELEGEAALTVGGPLHDYRKGLVHGAVIVGPHECMPCKIAEAQYGKLVESENIPYLAVPVTGDPVDTELLDRFAFDVHAQFSGRGPRRTLLPVLQPGRRAPCAGVTAAAAGSAVADAE